MASKTEFHESQASDEPRLARAAYERPELRRLGSVRELTLSGGGSVADMGGQGPPHTGGH
jgi:hypothetical protein